jgi:hypothetical protein
MSKIILFLAVAMVSSGVFADEKRFYPTRDGAGYEARLRQVGIPQSGGMVWPVLDTHDGSSSAVVLQASRPASDLRSAEKAASRAKPAV